MTLIGVGRAGEACVHRNVCLLWQDLAEGFLAPGNQGPAGFSFQGRQTVGDMWSGWSVSISLRVTMDGRGGEFPTHWSIGRWKNHSFGKKKPSSLHEADLSY